MKVRIERREREEAKEILVETVFRSPSNFLSIPQKFSSPKN
jgi:hypothetical protein